jgi:hypothetical protein
MSDEHSVDVGREPALVGSVDENGAFTSRSIQAQITRSTTPVATAAARPVIFRGAVQRARRLGRVSGGRHSRRARQ